MGNGTLKILVVEDEKDINDLLSMQLTREGHLVDKAFDGIEAISFISKNHYDVVVLDWMLPGANGIDVLKKIREEKNSQKTAVIMATARGHSDDVVMGLEAGADDYLAKPFDMNVLKARIKAVLRRMTMVDNADTRLLTVGGLAVNQREHTVSCQGQKIELTISEFKLLASMMHNYGRVMTRKELIHLIQGEGISVIDRSIDTHMVGLRKKLGPCADLVKTVRGVGYKIQVEPE
jgi:two-component system phosphate regulon response regulator PhoB